MLDAYIIEKIKQEELERQQRSDEGRRIWLERPRPSIEEPRDAEDAEADRGTIVIPLHPDDVEEDAA